MTTPYPLVTLSASYGAGGSVVGPGVAAALGVPFHDRAIPVTVAAELGVDLDAVAVHDGRAERGLARLLSAAARMPAATLGGIESYVSDARVLDENEVAARIGELVRGIARDAPANGGGVILGRAAAAVLAGEPGILHVRLDGPPAARDAQVCRLNGMDPKEARRRREKNDAARETYVKRLYGRDPRDPLLYHLVIDSTATPLEDCVALIAFAAEQRRAAAGAATSTGAGQP